VTKKKPRAAVKKPATKKRTAAPASKPTPDYETLTIDELEKHLGINQRKFVLHLVNGLNQTNAAIAAGYSPKSAASQASDLLKLPKVLAYRSALTRQVLNQACLTTEAISLKMIEVLERCMQAEPVLEWDSKEKDYVPTGIWKFDARGAVKVLELLGKNAGMFKDKVELSGDTGFRIELPEKTEGFSE